MKSSKGGTVFLFPVGSIKALTPQKIYLYPSTDKRTGALLLHSLQCLARWVLLFVFRKAWVSESQHMEPSRLLRWGHAVTVGMVQCDRCSCRPAQRANRTIPLICYLIPLSTGLQPRSMLIINGHMQTLGLVKEERKFWVDSLKESQRTT